MRVFVASLVVYAIYNLVSFAFLMLRLGEVDAALQYASLVWVMNLPNALWFIFLLKFYVNHKKRFIAVGMLVQLAITYYAFGSGAEAIGADMRIIFYPVLTIMTMIGIGVALRLTK